MCPPIASRWCRRRPCHPCPLAPAHAHKLHAHKLMDRRDECPGGTRRRRSRPSCQSMIRKAGKRLFRTDRTQQPSSGSGLAGQAQRQRDPARRETHQMADHGRRKPAILMPTPADRSVTKDDPPLAAGPVQGEGKTIARFAIKARDAVHTSRESCSPCTTSSSPSPSSESLHLSLHPSSPCRG